MISRRYLLFLVLFSSTASAAIDFVAPRSFRTLVFPARTAVADLNGDGVLDFVVGSASRITVSYGHSDGTFGNAVEIFEPTSALLICRDFTGDGVADILTMSSGRLVIHDGPSLGAAIATPLNPQSSAPFAGVAADFDGDQKLDVALAMDTLNSVWVMRNTGDGHFTQTNYPAGIGPGAIRAADFNGDGKPDVVVSARSGSSAAVLLNNGSGFAPPVSLATSAIPSDLAAGDFNSDGRTDLFMPTFSPAADLFLGNGDGTFAPRRSVTLPATSVGTLGLAQGSAVGDFNHDGGADIVTRVKLYGKSWAVTLLGNGDGTFRDGGRFLCLGPIVAADFNRDGNLDLGIGNDVDNSSVTRFTMAILLGRGDGTFATPSVVFPETASEQSPGGHAIAAADFDGDGLPDIAEVAAGGVVILKSNGNGTFTARTTTVAAAPGITIAADLDNDGRLDLAIVNGASMILAFNRGDLLFDTASTAGLTVTSNIGAGDIDGDGRTDLVVANTSTRQLAILHNRGGRAFDPPKLIPLSPGPDVYPSAVVVRDLDGDGRSDLVVSRFVYGGFDVYRQLSSGELAAPVFYDTSDAGSTLVDDFDGDGHFDVVNGGVDELNISLGRGDGTFQPGESIEIHGQAFPALSSADFDGDGILDLLADDITSNELLIYAGKGDGSFAPPVRFSVGLSSMINVADFDGDEKPDIAARADAVTVVIFNRSTLSDSGTRTWTGAASTATWSNGANWTGGIVPAPGDELVFATAAKRRHSVNDLAAGTEFGRITLAGAHAMEGNEIALEGGIQTRGAASTVSLPLRLKDFQLWTIGADAPLSITGTTNLNGNELALDAAGSAAGVTFLGPITGTGSIVVPFTTARVVIRNATSTMVGTIDQSGQATMIIDGARIEGANVQVNHPSGMLILSGGAVIGDLTVRGRIATAGGGGNLTGSTRSFTMHTTGSLSATILGTADGLSTRIAVTGPVSLSNPSLKLGAALSIPEGTTVTIIDNDGADPVAGTFGGRPEGSLITASGSNQQFRITYKGGSGNDIALTALTPPSTTPRRRAIH